eukprot:2324100-Prymnesium_polylepis.2
MVSQADGSSTSKNDHSEESADGIDIPAEQSEMRTNTVSAFFLSLIARSVDAAALQGWDSALAAALGSGIALAACCTLATDRHCTDGSFTDTRDEMDQGESVANDCAECYRWAIAALLLPWARKNAVGSSSSSSKDQGSESSCGALPPPSIADSETEVLQVPMAEVNAHDSRWPWRLVSLPTLSSPSQQHHIHLPTATLKAPSKPLHADAGSSTSTDDECDDKSLLAAVSPTMTVARTQLLMAKLMAADAVCCVGSIHQRVQISTNINERTTAVASVMSAHVCLPMSASCVRVSAPTAGTWTRQPQPTSFAVALLFLPCAMVEALPPHRTNAGNAPKHQQHQLQIWKRQVASTPHSWTHSAEPYKNSAPPRVGLPKVARGHTRCGPR